MEGLDKAGKGGGGDGGEGEGGVWLDVHEYYERLHSAYAEYDIIGMQ